MSDVNENLLREVLLPTGVVDVKVAALDVDCRPSSLVAQGESMTATPALIFDFDGLLVDTESSALLAWREQFAVHELVFRLRSGTATSDPRQPTAMVDELRLGGVDFVDAEDVGGVASAPQSHRQLRAATTRRRSVP